MTKTSSWRLNRRTLEMLSAVAVVAIVASGFVPLFSLTKPVMASFPEEVTTSAASRIVETVTGISPSTSYSVTTGQLVTTAQNQIYTIGSIILDCGHWVLVGAPSLNAGSQATVSFAASGNLSVFVFNKAEYSSFKSSNQTSPNVVQIVQRPNGTVNFTVPASGSYYLVITNLASTTGCLAGTSVGLYNAQGYVSFLQTTQYFVTYTNVQDVNITYTTTSTAYTTSTYQTTIESVGTQTCVLGWLQAIISGCA